MAPVDARLERDDVRFETVTLGDLLVSTAGASLRLVVLDACRNNPLARSMQRTAATRTVSGESFGDLNEDLLGDETLVADAAAGTTAADGRGRNSPYTAALLTHLETPLEIGLLFRRVRAEVLEATDGEQRPHEYHSLVNEHYLTRTLPAGTSVTVNAAAPTAPAPADPPRPDPPETDVTELPIAALRELPEAGVAAAQTELGGRYEHARGVEGDYGVAGSWFRRAADQGHAPGQAALDFLYARGLAVPQDDVEVVRWSRRAAEQGNARAQSNLGILYRDGRGTSRDHEVAVSWFLRFRRTRGTPAGRPTSGRMYATGRGVSLDDTEAVRWYRRAAEQGPRYRPEQTRRGGGVRRDRVEAVRWYRLARFCPNNSATSRSPASRTARYSCIGTRGGSGHAALPCISARMLSVPCSRRARGRSAGRPGAAGRRAARGSRPRRPRARRSPPRAPRRELGEVEGEGRVVERAAGEPSVGPAERAGVGPAGVRAERGGGEAARGRRGPLERGGGGAAGRERIVHGNFLEADRREIALRRGRLCRRALVQGFIPALTGPTTRSTGFDEETSVIPALAGPTSTRRTPWRVRFASPICSSSGGGS